MSGPNGKQRYNKGWDNLRPAKPGECRNPSGRPKGSVSLLTRVKRRLRQVCREEGAKAGRKYADLAAEAYVNEMLRGNFRHAKELFDREDGPLTDETAGTTVNIQVTQLSRDELVRIARRGGKGTA